MKGSAVDRLRSFDRFLFFAIGSTGLSALFYVIVAMVLGDMHDRDVGLVQMFIGLILFTLTVGLLFYGPLLLAAIVVGFPTWVVLVPWLLRAGTRWPFSILLGACTVAFLAVATCTVFGLAYDQFDLTWGLLLVALQFWGLGAV